MDQKIGQLIDSYRDDLIATLSRWIGVPSVKAEPAEGAPFGTEVRRMLDMASRLQVYYAGKRFAGIAPPLKRPKRGAVLLTGGGDGAPDRALASARLLLGCMGVSAADEAPCAVSLRTDSLPAREDEAALNAARDIGRMLSRASELP